MGLLQMAQATSGGPLGSADSDSVSLGRTMGGLEQLQVNLSVCDPDVSRRCSHSHQ